MKKGIIIAVATVVVAAATIADKLITKTDEEIEVEQNLKEQINEGGQDICDAIQEIGRSSVTYAETVFLQMIKISLSAAFCMWSFLQYAWSFLKSLWRYLTDMHQQMQCEVPVE